MPRVAIPVNEIVREGLAQPAQVTADATNDHYIAGNDGQVFIEVVSTDASPRTVTVHPSPSAQADGLTIAPLVLTVGAGATEYFGPFKPSTFNQEQVARQIWLDPSVSTTLKFRAYKIIPQRV
jgi:hypothetical protein